MIRTRVKNGLQHLTLNQGMQKKRRLWSEAARSCCASCRWRDGRRAGGRTYSSCWRCWTSRSASWIGRYSKLPSSIRKRKLLMTQPGVGPNHGAGLRADHRRGERVRRGKQVASYLGLIPREHSSGGRQRLGCDQQARQQLSAHAAGGSGAECSAAATQAFRKQYLHRCHSKAKGVAKVAAARKLAVRLYWMLRTQTAYPEIVRIESSPRVPRSAQARPLN